MSGGGGGAGAGHRGGGPQRDAGGPDVPEGAALLELVAIMDRLRRECPWDARQTHESLAPYLLEETYEALEAIESRDLAELRGELGDVLLQVLFHSRVAAERTDGTGFTIDDVANGIAAKLVRRHPHVFADVSVTGADEVKKNWDTIKAEERAAARGGPGSALDGVPMGQPALSLAAQLQRRARSAGVPEDLADLATVPSGAGGNGGASPFAGDGGASPFAGDGGTGPVRGDGGTGAVGRAGELGRAGEAGGAGEAGEAGEAGAAGSVSAIGAELFALAARARAAGLDPELELRHAARVYRDRVQAWERSGSP